MHWQLLFLTSGLVLRLPSEVTLLGTLDRGYGTPWRVCLKKWRKRQWSSPSKTDATYWELTRTRHPAYILQNPWGRSTAVSLHRWDASGSGRWRHSPKTTLRLGPRSAWLHSPGCWPPAGPRPSGSRGSGLGSPRAPRKRDGAKGRQCLGATALLCGHTQTSWCLWVPAALPACQMRRWKGTRFGRHSEHLQLGCVMSVILIIRTITIVHPEEVGGQLCLEC